MPKGHVIWGLVGHGPHGHPHKDDHHIHDHELAHKRTLRKQQPLVKRLAAIVVPFGIKACQRMED